jgi:hypothetical protein
MVRATIQFCELFAKKSEQLSDSTRQESMWPLLHSERHTYDEHEPNEKNKNKTNCCTNMMPTWYKANLIVFSVEFMGNFYQIKKKKKKNKKKNPNIKVVDRKYTIIIQAIINTLINI